MAKNKLSDRKINLLKPSNREQNAGDGDGLWLRVNPLGRGGKKSFYYRYQYNGKARRLGLGDYPATSLAAAREKRGQAQTALAAGRDPALYLSIEAGALTVRGLFDVWVVSVLSAHADQGKKISGHFAHDVFPFIGDKPAALVTHDDIIFILEKVVSRGAKAKASKLLSWLRALFGFGIRRRMVQADPTAHLRAADVGAKENSKTRNLSFDELRLLAAAVPAAGLPLRVQAALWVLLGTGCRPVELRRARPADVDLAARAWVLPQTKNDSEFIIYLSDFTLCWFKVLLDFANDQWLLVGRDPRKPVAEDYLRKMIGERIATVQRKKSTPHAGALAMPGGPWSIYDLRRTMASRMGDIGVAPHVIEACLNHKPPGVKGVYQRQLYLSERMAAFTAWGDYLKRL